MTREELINAMPIIKAFINGETVQYKGLDHEWKDLGVNDLDLDDFVESAWRIKPESKYRPFKDTKECWQEMQKHQPFGWVINISNGRAYNLQSVLIEDGVLYIRSSYVELGRAFIDYTFADGTPFGVKVEK